MTRPVGTVRLAAALAGGLLALTGCSEDAEPAADRSPTPTPTTSAPDPPVATAAPVPAERTCYRLAYDEAVAPTADQEPVDCQTRHTSVTYAVGRLDNVVDGHLLAVDADRVQAQVAAACPERLAPFVGGTREDRQLSMLRAVWFTPSVEESDAGAAWFRCDVVALAGPDRLAPLTGRVAGVLDDPAGRERYGMCGTAQPGTKGFERVVCSAKHSWRAIAVVPLAGDAYPGEKSVRAAGEDPCSDAGAAAADSALDYEWGYEWPTAEQWGSGQHYGRCWAPD
ncbi:septum formation family protein [Nocardioides sp.]|uniref:septum formation family protein n=1 Tax=Nocardioides sp. TaxID=35761 RepID=UPI002EDA4F9B